MRKIIKINQINNSQNILIFLVKIAYKFIKSILEYKVFYYKIN